jgi:hypothetical protein
MELQCLLSQRQYVVGVLITLAFLVSCTAPVAPTTVSSTALPPTATYTPTPSLVPPTVTASPTFTPAPPTLTPVPTLTANERQALVQEMLKTNGGCELPCWWGIVPGQTDWQTLKNRFTAYGGSVFDVPHSTPPFDYRITHSFVQQNGIVESIQVTSEVLGSATSDRFAKDWQRLSLDQILTRYGVPSQVLLFLLPATERGAIPRYGLTVTYNHLGFSIYYEGLSSVSEPKVRACPVMKRVLLVLLKLQQPTPNTSSTQPIFPSGKPFVHPLQEATGMSLETFHETFKNANRPACLDIPSMWP